ncbi:MAG: hypothetical protein V3T14_10285, partial [Myxococcota bacterium]
TIQPTILTGGINVAAITDDARPSSAFAEPQSLTGLNSGALPARPANPSRGLYYMTHGLDRARKKHHSLVSNLDVDFREDELRWAHGASQDEHEFREGYLEFEMFDSQLFARVGKLLMVWGKTELFRNMDRLNPVDIGISTLSSLEESRIGQWAADMIWYWGYVGPVEDVRTELAIIYDDFEPVDLGKCGEPFVFLPVCGKSFGSMASGLAGLGLVGEARPPDPWDSLSGLDVAFRIEGRWNRFTFAIADFYGYDDGAVLEVVHQFGRRVDPTTGAPVQSSGPLTCTTAPGGPNGFVGDGDDEVPFVGNCLLFTSDGARRAPDVVALNHAANQTLFHTICTLTFNEDAGGCPFDTINNAELLNPTAEVLGGNPAFGAVAIAGFDTIRTKQAPFEVLDQFVPESDLFASLNNGPGRPSLAKMTPDQQALLGCGPRFGTGCDGSSAQLLVDAGVLDEAAGGVDFMNADASVATQDWTILKAGSPGALVGFRRGATFSYFEAGVTAPDGWTPETAAAITAAGGDATQVALAISGVDKTDFQIEPFPFNPRMDLLEQGILIWDPNSPNPNGEYCGQTSAGGLLPGGPSAGCTDLEIFSANLERLLITNEIFGADDSFDPPESLAEILAMTDGDETNDLFGDPLSGADGIVFNNVDTDGDGIDDRKGLRVDFDTFTPITQSQLVPDPSVDCGSPTCYLDITQGVIDSGDAEGSGASPTGAVRIVSAVPVKVRANVVGGGAVFLNPGDLAADDLQKLL